jgi:hypothetical protein
MTAMTKWLSKAKHRRWLYGVALTVVPLLVAYGVVEESAAPLWVALIGSLLAPSLALTHMSEDSPES